MCPKSSRTTPARCYHGDLCQECAQPTLPLICYLIGQFWEEQNPIGLVSHAAYITFLPARARKKGMKEKEGNSFYDVLSKKPVTIYSITDMGIQSPTAKRRGGTPPRGQTGDESKTPCTGYFRKNTLANQTYGFLIQNYR